MYFSITVFLILLGSYNLYNGNRFFDFDQMVPQTVPKISETLIFVPFGFLVSYFCILLQICNPTNGL